MENSARYTYHVKGISPVRIFTITIIGIFLAEVVAMLLINRLGWLPFAWQTLLDAMIVTVLIFPLLYFLTYKPLLTHLTDRERAESELRVVQAGLEQRTHELSQINAELSAEIAERIRTETQLRLQSAALEAAANGIIITGRRGNIRWANPAFSRMTGYGLEDVLGENPRLLKSGQHEAEFYQTMWETILSGQVWHGETINRRKDGSLYQEEQTITPLLDENGEITNFIAIKHDVTKRKLAEQALRKNEALLRTVLESLPVGVWITDEKGNVLQGNPASLEIWAGARYVGIEGYGEYKGWWLDSGKRIEPEEWAAARAIRHGERVLNEEVEIECFDGTHKVILNSAIPFADEQGTVRGVVAVNQDITDRKKAVESLHQERSKLRNILDTMQDGVYIVNQEYDIEYINPVIEKEFGPINGRKCYQYFHELTEICEWCKNRRVFAGESLNWEWYSTKNGKTYELFDTPLVNPDGSISKLEIFHDVTERKRAEEQLAFRNKELLDLTNAERKQRQTAEALCAAAQSLTQTLRLEYVVDSLLDHINRIIPYDTASVALMEDEAHLTMRAVRGNGHWTDFSAILEKQAATNSIIHELFSSRKSLVIPKLTASPVREIAPSVEQFQSWLVTPIITGEKAIGVVWLGKSEPEFFAQEQAEWTEALVGQAGVALQNAWLFEQVRADSERLQFLAHRLVDVQENELRYIAQELHDEVGQAITALELGLQLIQREADKPEVIRAESAKMDRVVDNVMENLHRLAMNLHPASLDRLGLQAALLQHIETLREKISLEIQFEMIGVNERLPANVEIALFRIVQEAINNVVRHAQATQVDVLIQTRNGSLVILIEDNGVGFDPEIARNSDRLGLFGMRERAEMLGGKLVIESSAGHGTTILVEVPNAYSNSHRG
jgi:PAS domain S-box-containing protein